jgi:LDH2 family malate/lactate/ureidoglycolate dehydrogenase
MPRRRAGDGAAKDGVDFTGAATAMLGTDPIAAVLPGRDGPPFPIEMSLSEVATLTRAKGIPLGWALDKWGNLAADLKAGLEGSMLPAGGVKGAMLALEGRTAGHGAHRRTDGLRGQLILCR